MKHNVVAPSVGESITEVGILKWAKKSGEAVKVGDLLLELESDKATVEIVAEHAGVLQIVKEPGSRFPIGEIVGTIDDAGVASIASASAGASPAPQKAATATAQMPGTPNASTLSPAVRKIVTENSINPSQVAGTGKDGRLTKGDVLPFVGAPQRASAPAASAPAARAPAADRVGDRRVPLTMLRQRIAERLVQAQHTAAILTTFNEVDMTEVNKVRTQFKDAFKAKHGVSLGFMSFFTKACIAALKAIPEVNATLDGRDTVYHDYFDIGVAVGSERGLVVPVVRDADKMGFVEIEKKITELATKARDGKLSIAELSGGTFTISNGGVYGSLLSTPILNPPQSGILGMHKIQERPVVVPGTGGAKIEIRPMMYLALSYDHRLIDGKGAVTFLITVKEHLENPKLLGLDFQL